MDKPHPNGIHKDYIREGYSDGLPEVGIPFYIESQAKWFCTSMITEVDFENQIFKTNNSVYSWKIKQQ